VNLPQWLQWAREIQALSQSGRTFAQNDFDLDRYRRLTEIAAEIIETYSDYPKEKLVAEFLAQPGYATPKIDVRGAVVREDKILLVKERQDGRWCMPGGWVDVGESPAQSVVREVREESGFIVEPHKIVAVCDANRSGRPIELYHAFKIIFLCRTLGGEATASYETEAVDFFDFTDLPPLSENRTNTRHLSQVHDHLINPLCSAYFD